jgi:pyruvate,orthophosphate dikinase
MLGHRGCRLALTYPEILEMQVTAIVEAAINCVKRGLKPIVEIMHPLVGTKRELAMLREMTETTIAATRDRMRFTGKLEILIGTMIEVPRATVRADEIAEHADFFSFGTNDLTQLTFGYSRDDVNTFLPTYLAKEILEGDPFQSLDQSGVGDLVRMGIDKGRSVKNGLKVGICGEHGGDPASVGFCHHAEMDYVSCSPFRVPIARLAAAQVVLRDKKAADAAAREAKPAKAGKKAAKGKKKR